MRVQFIRHASRVYAARAELVDTDYGPENKLTVTDASGRTIYTAQEPMGTQGMIADFKDWLAQRGNVLEDRESSVDLSRSPEPIPSDPDEGTVDLSKTPW